MEHRHLRTLTILWLDIRLNMDIKIHGIYRIWHTASNRSYVGSAVDVAKRLGSHFRMLKRKAHHSVKLQRAWDKYGETAFNFSIVEIVESKEKLVEREQHWIGVFDSCRSGFNMAPIAGSILGYTFSDESKNRMSEAATGHIKSDEHRRNLSLANKGKKMSDEARRKMSEAKLGTKRKPHSEETRAKMSATRIGFKPSKESVEKMAAAKRGRKLSEETRAKMSTTHKKLAAAKALATQALAQVANSSKAESLLQGN